MKFSKYHDWQRKVWVGAHLICLHIPTFFWSKFDTTAYTVSISLDTNIHEICIPMNKWKRQWKYAKAKELIWFLKELFTLMNSFLILRVANLGKPGSRTSVAQKKNLWFRAKEWKMESKCTTAHLAGTHGLFQVCGGGGRRECASLPASLIWSGLVPDIIHTLSSKRELA